MSQSVWQEHNAAGTPAEQQCQCAECRAYRGESKEGIPAPLEAAKESPAVQSLLQKLQAALTGTK